jgi:hypothetical protein
LQKKNLIKMAEQQKAAEEKARVEARLKQQLEQQSSKLGSEKEFIRDAEGLQKSLLERFQALQDLTAKSIAGSSIVNGGWEADRKRLKVSDKMKLDGSNIFTRPTLDDLQKLGWNPEANQVATAENLAKISAKLKELGVPPEHMARTFWDVAMYCTAVGASRYTNPQGSINYPEGSITRDAIFGVIREQCTLRQVCRSFAPIIWNYMHVNNMPPTNWAEKGFNNDVKFAAFDFFDFVECPASIQPADGLIRRPTSDEYIAFNTHKKNALARADRNSRYASNDASVTGGMFGCGAKENWRNNAC